MKELQCNMINLDICKHVYVLVNKKCIEIASQQTFKYIFKLCIYVIKIVILTTVCAIFTNCF